MRARARGRGWKAEGGWEVKPLVWHSLDSAVRAQAHHLVVMNSDGVVTSGHAPVGRPGRMQHARHSVSVECVCVRTRVHMRACVHACVLYNAICAYPCLSC